MVPYANFFNGISFSQHDFFKTPLENWIFLDLENKERIVDSVCMVFVSQQHTHPREQRKKKY